MSKGQPTDPLNIPKARDLIIASRMLVTALKEPRDEADVNLWIGQVDKALDAIFMGQMPEGAEPAEPFWEDDPQPRRLTKIKTPSAVNHPLRPRKHPRIAARSLQDASHRDLVPVANDPRRID